MQTPHSSQGGIPEKRSRYGQTNREDSTMDNYRDEVEMEQLTTDWTDLLGRLVALQELPVTVRITERGARIAELHRQLHRSMPVWRSRGSAPGDLRDRGDAHDHNHAEAAGSGTATPWTKQVRPPQAYPPSISSEHSQARRRRAARPSVPRLIRLPLRPGLGIAEVQASKTAAVSTSSGLEMARHCPGLSFGQAAGA